MKKVGSFAIVTKENKILLVLLPEWAEYGNHWNLPGGVVNDTENLEDAAEREVLEETGIECKCIKQFLRPEDIKSAMYSIYIFIAKYLEGNIKIQEDEIDDAHWFSIDEIAKLPLAYDTKNILMRYFETPN